MNAPPYRYQVPPAETVYRGVRLVGDRGEPFGVVVSADGIDLRQSGNRELREIAESGLEWGYRGAGPHRLARALILHATGSPSRSIACMTWFGWAVVSGWGDRWSITAGEIRAWLDRYDNERRAERDLDDRPVVVELTEGGVS